jgi:GNAT superfamily N-acetyltransferase
METVVELTRRYPISLRLPDGLAVTLRQMRSDDVDRVLQLGRSLPADDLVFLRMDITDRAVVEGWAQQLERDRAVSLLAEAGGALIGYGSLFHSELTWQRHLGEIRLLVDRPYRSRGLGHVLVGELFRIARGRGLRKIAAHLTADQKGAQKMFERHGFTAEALLQDFVIDRQGRTRDLVVMACDVEGLSNCVD